MRTRHRVRPIVARHELGDPACVAGAEVTLPVEGGEKDAVTDTKSRVRFAMLIGEFGLGHLRGKKRVGGSEGVEVYSVNERGGR